METKKNKIRIEKPLTNPVLTSRKYLIIGGTSGIGLAIAKVLIEEGSDVTIVGRTNPHINYATFMCADLSSVPKQQKFAREVPDPEKIDSIIFTNGIICEPKRVTNEEGIEIDLAVSYVSRYVISKILLDRGFGTVFDDGLGFSSSHPSHFKNIFIMGYACDQNSVLATKLLPGLRIDCSDLNSEISYDQFRAHMNTVVANDALVLYLSRHTRPSVNIIGLNPGIISTGIRKPVIKNSVLYFILESFIKMFFPSADKYARRTFFPILIAAENNKTMLNGMFFDSRRRELSPSEFLSNPSNVTAIINATDALIEKHYIEDPSSYDEESCEDVCEDIVDDFCNDACGEDSCDDAIFKEEYACDKLQEIKDL